MLLEPSFVTDRNGRSLTFDPHPAQKKGPLFGPRLQPATLENTEKAKMWRRF